MRWAFSTDKMGLAKMKLLLLFLPLWQIYLLATFVHNDSHVQMPVTTLKQYNIMMYKIDSNFSQIDMKLLIARWFLAQKTVSILMSKVHQQQLVQMISQGDFGEVTLSSLLRRQY